MESYSSGVYEVGYYEGHFDDTVPYLINCCGFFKPCQLYNSNKRTRCDHYFIYLTKGKGYYKFKDKYIEVTEGSLVYIRPDTYQDIYYPLENDPEYYWLHFTGSESENLMITLGFWDNPIQKVGKVKEVMDLFEKIIYELQVKKTLFEHISLGYMMEIFVLLSRSKLALDGSLFPERNTQISNAVIAMHKESTIEHSISHYSNISNLSIYQFTRTFKKIMGTSPNKYIENIRISSAKNLLHITDLNISQIADLVGYKDSFYFSKVFKKNTGKTPTQFREEALLEQQNRTF